MPYPNLKQSVWLLILFFLISAALGVPVAILGFILDQTLHGSPYVIWLLTLISFVLVAVYSKRRTDRTWRNVLQLRPVSWQLSLPLGVSIIGLAIVGTDLGNLLRDLIPAPEIIVNALKELADKESPFGLAFYVMVVQAPLTEEVLFRGIILGGLLAHRTRNRAVVWSAVLFALFHGNPWQFPIALILGIVFASWVIQTGSLIPAIAGHALNNFLALTVAHLELFGPIDSSDTVVYYPWWLLAGGIVLALVGLRWFNQIAKREGTPLDPPADPEPIEAAAAEKSV